MSSKPKILLSPPDVGNDELEAIISAFKSGWIAPLGPEVTAFEKDLADYIGVKSSVALSSGTAAIHLALILSDVNPGDIVFCSTFTFAASAFPIRYLGAEPVFIDSESTSWNMCPTLLTQALDEYTKAGKKPKAVIAVDLYGMPCNWDAISSVCSDYGVNLIEDAAEGLGATYKGKRLGSFGQMGVLSFNGNKIITTSGGGALVSNDSGLIERARFLATQAREPVVHYEHNEIGYNYRMSNLLAALGRAQLKTLDDKVRRRREIFDFYRETLGKIEGVKFLSEPEGAFSNRWLPTTRFELRGTSRGTSVGIVERVRVALEKEGIESRPLWKPIAFATRLRTSCYGGASRLRFISKWR